MTPTRPWHETTAREDMAVSREAVAEATKEGVDVDEQAVAGDIKATAPLVHPRLR